MATKYTLQSLDGEILKTVSKKQAAIKFAEDQSLEAFRVVTDSGNVVYEQVPEFTAPEPEDAGLPADEDLIGEVATEAAAEPEIVYSEVLEFPGNYSIVTAPLALEIAAAAGVPAKVENIPGSLTRKVHFGGDDTDLAARTVSLVQEVVDSTLASLKVWQKANLEKRRGLTDMQRYIQHREFIAAAGTRAAKQVKKDGV